MELARVRWFTENGVLEVVLDTGPDRTDTGCQIDLVGRRQDRPFSPACKAGTAHYRMAGRRYSRPDRVRNEPMRRANGRRVKIHLSYSIEEAARCVGVHKNTVRRWLSSGLSAIDARRP